HPYLHSFPTRRSSDLSALSAISVPQLRHCMRMEERLYGSHDDEHRTERTHDRRAGWQIEHQRQIYAKCRHERAHRPADGEPLTRSEEHTSELQSLAYL